MHQLGAAPPPLQFDNDNEEGDEDKKGPAKDEEFIWQWKVRSVLEPLESSIRGATY